MNLLRAIKFSFISLLSIALASCVGSDDYTTTYPSSDAQIYGLKIAGTATNAIDSINYPIMAKTKFAIDQFRQHIYNPDSLPYRTDLKKKLAATIAFNSAGVGKVSLLYANDSVADWGGNSDSIDFSTPSYPKFVLTAPDGVTKKTYTIDIRVHKVNPDTLVWENVSNTKQISLPSTVASQKTLLKESAFYTFSVDTDNKLYLHKAQKGSSYAVRKALNGLPAASKFNLESILLFNDIFYATDADKKVYMSTDGISWQEKFSGVETILGVVPAMEESNDYLLAVTQDNYLSKITRTNTLEKIRVLNDTEKGKLPLSGFSSVTNYNRANKDLNLLMITGGSNASNKVSNQTWLVQISSDQKLQLMPTDEHKVFTSKLGIPTFMYDNYLYALVSKKLYRSVSFGTNWTSAPTDLEFLDPKMPKASGQSVIVDEDNYIWVFGGIQDNNTLVHEVWRGRLNKLNPKK